MYALTNLGIRTRTLCGSRHHHGGDGRCHLFLFVNLTCCLREFLPQVSQIPPAIFVSGARQGYSSRTRRDSVCVLWLDMGW